MATVTDKTGSSVTGQDLDSATNTTTDLSGASVSATDLVGSEITETDLSMSNSHEYDYSGLTYEDTSINYDGYALQGVVVDISGS